jgi:hypothetical protein
MIDYNRKIGEEGIWLVSYHVMYIAFGSLLVSTQAVGKNLTQYPTGTMRTHEGHKENEFSTKNNFHLHYSG